MNDVNRDQPGLKLDQEKLRYDLIEPYGEREKVAVLTFGAVKYDAWNWKKIEEERYIAAIGRHVSAHRMGLMLDTETKLLHLAHAACCIDFVMGMVLEKQTGLRGSFPDRYEHAMRTARELRERRLIEMQEKKRAVMETLVK